MSDKKHEHLEIHALVDGGYVVREGRFNGYDDDVGRICQERAGFSTLDQALKWLNLNMVEKSPEA